MKPQSHEMKHDFNHRRNTLLQAAAARLGARKIMVCNPLNLLYLTGLKFTPYERFMALIMDVDTTSSRLILPSLEAGAAIDPAIEAQYYDDDQNPYALAAAMLDGYDPVGVEKSYLPVSRLEAVFATGRAGDDMGSNRVVDVDDLITRLRIVKTDSEIECHRRAAQNSDELLASIAGLVRPGRTEKQIAADMMLAMSAMDQVSIDPVIIQVLAGTRAANPHGASTDYVILPGDGVTIDFGICHAHYWSDCTRTFFAGRPGDRMREIYDIVRQAQLAAIDAAAAGVPCAQVDRAARQVIQKAGYGECFIHRLGHGLGLDIHEAPSMHGRNQAILQPGMVVTIEPGIYIHGVGGVRIEDDICITTDGCTVLSQYPKHIEQMIH